MNPQHKKRLHWETRKDDIVINIEARQVIKFLRWVFGWRRRKRQDKKNGEIESTRIKHIQSNHRANNDKAWR